MRHIVPISGKDSLACALLQTARKPGLPYEYLFTDTEAELPETYEWLDHVEAMTGWKIVRLGESLLARILGRHGFLPGPRSRYCTKECKIEPMENWLSTDEATIYYGLRADEKRLGYVPVKGSRITPEYPLRDAGIDIGGVYSILDAQALAPPTFFWPWLYGEVHLRVSPKALEGLSRTERTVLFSGRTRGNCFCCFFQRQYEFLWLYDVHHDLYEQARDLEKDDYTFQPGFKLSKLEDEGVRRHIMERRVKEVCDYIGGKAQGSLMPLVGDTEIALTSCGLLCGK